MTETDATRKLHPSTAVIVDRLVARLKEHDAWVKAHFVDPDYRKRMTIEEVIAALSKFT